MLTKLYKPMFSLLVFSMVCGMLYWLYQNKAHNPAAPEHKEKPDKDIGLRFTNVELRGREEGSPFFTIWSEEVEVSRSKGKQDGRMVYFRKNPHGEFYNLKDWEKSEKEREESGELPLKRSLIWKSDYAEYDRHEERLLMKKHVEIITDKNDNLKTDEVLWDKKSERLTSSTRSVVLTHKNTYMEANQLEAKTKLKELYLEGNVYIETDVKSDQSLDFDIDKEEDE